MELRGLGEVMDGVLEVNVNAVRTIAQQDIHWVKKIGMLLSGAAEYILGIFYVFFTGKYKSFVFFKGVKIGEFELKYDWFKGHMLA